MPPVTKRITLKTQQLKKLVQDPVATAKAVQLIYVNSHDEGIIRVKAGKGFRYVYRNRTVRSKDALQRIRSLVIPPAWKEVWICSLPQGHLQATGKDLRNRKQYRYHALWNELRNQTKFYHMLEFGRVLPAIRKQVAKDLALPGLQKNKILAAIISLMEKTDIRIGSGFYEKLYGSFGITTLKDNHVRINGSKMKFSFRGKKGIEHHVSLQSKKLARIVARCRDIPGKELFQYIDEDGRHYTIESGMVNEYIRNITGGDFTAKDFRTWSGSVAALRALKEAGPFLTAAEARKKVVAALDKVAAQLGNTRAVCKKYYVHPSLPDLYEKGKLQNWLDKMDEGDKKHSYELSTAEKLLVAILKSLK